MNEELKKLADDINVKQEEIVKLIEDKAKKADFDTVKNELEAIKTSLKELSEKDHSTDLTDLTSKLEALQKQADEQGVAVTKFETIYINKGVQEDLSLERIISETLKDDEFTGFLKKKKGTTDAMQLKLVGDMTESGNLTAGSVLVTAQPPRGILELKTRPVHMRELLSVGTTDKDRIPVVKQANYEDGADMVAENTSSTETDMDLAETYVQVERLATHLIVSKDLLDDIPALTSFISNHLPKRMMTKEDQQILFGSGTTPEIQGITGVASAFAAGSFATAVPAANEIDVLRVALANLNTSYYSPSAIILNPVDVALIDMLKTSSTREYLGNNYLVSRDGNSNIMRIAGIPVIASTAMTAGYFCIGDFTDGAELFDRKKLTMQMSDSHSDYFIKNMVTITFEERIALPVYYNGAFCYGQFSVAKAAITSGS